MPNVTEEFLDLQGLQSYDTKIKEVIADKVDKVTGKGLSTEDAEALTTQQVNTIIALFS